MAKKRARAKKLTAVIKTSSAETSIEEAVTSMKFANKLPPLGQVCRLCETHDGPFLNIFDDEKHTAQIIEDLLPFEVTECDELTHKICFRCSAKVEELHEFVQKCIKTQDNLCQDFGKKYSAKNKLKTLRSLWEGKLNKSNTSSDAICDAVIKKAMTSLKTNSADTQLVDPPATTVTVDNKLARTSLPKTTSINPSNVLKGKRKLKAKHLYEPNTNKSEDENSKTEIAISNAEKCEEIKITRSTRSRKNELQVDGVEKTATNEKNVSDPTTSTPIAANKVTAKSAAAKSAITVAENKCVEQTGISPIKLPTYIDDADVIIMEKEKIFNIMDHVCMIKVNGVGVLFQCKLCNRNFLKKEIVLSHLCAKNGVAKEDFSKQHPQKQIVPPRVPTVKYINTKKVDDKKTSQIKSLQAEAEIELKNQPKHAFSSQQKMYMPEKVDDKKNIQIKSLQAESQIELKNQPKHAFSSQQKMYMPEKVDDKKTIQIKSLQAEAEIELKNQPKHAFSSQQKMYMPEKVDDKKTIQIKSLQAEAEIEVKNQPKHAFSSQQKMYMPEIPEKTPVKINEMVTKPKIGPASRVKKPANDSQVSVNMAATPETQNEQLQTLTKVSTNTGTPNTGQSSAVPNHGCQYKLIPGPNNTFKLVEAQKPKDDQENKVNATVPKREKSSFEDLQITKTKPLKVTEKYSTNDTLLANVSNGKPGASGDSPYPVGLIKSVPRPTTSGIVPFTVSAQKKQSYSVVPTNNPSKILILAQPTKTEPEIPKKRQKITNQEVLPKEPFSVTLEENRHSENQGYLTLLNVDPLLQPSYVLPTDNTLQDGLASTSQKLDDNTKCTLYTCNICNVKFTREKKLLAHIQSHYPKSDEEEQLSTEKNSRKRKKKM